MVVVDIHQKISTEQEAAFDKNRLLGGTNGGITTAQSQSKSVILNAMGSSLSCFHSSPRGQPPPPPPRSCFGRDKLIEKVVELAKNLEPVALIGAGGIGKTTIALETLHHPQIKRRFGDNCRFIRCDQFPATRAHFLARLSKVIGAGVENPEDLTTLRPFLSSKEIIIVLDNAESVLDPRGTDAMEIHSVVEELCQFKTISILITSRIAAAPRHCKHLEIPTLSMKAAWDIFHGVYGNNKRSDIMNDLLRSLDFHALSVTLFATTAALRAWTFNLLVKEWYTQRARVLQTGYNANLAATIELLLTSPAFLKLGSNARHLLEVVAFFPQGIDESNLDWLFPTISDRNHIFDKFCTLSLTYRSNNFITMLAPIRDYLTPRDPRSSPLLCTTRDHYFRRLLVDVNPGKPGFEEARWIVSEDVNVEHLLDVLTSFDQNTADIWDAGYSFMRHLYWFRPRETILRSRIEALPDGNPYKPKHLSELSRLFRRMKNYTQQKRLLTLTLELERRLGDAHQVGQTLLHLSDANRLLGLHEEGIRRAKEALEIYEWGGGVEGQAQSLNQLAWLFFDAKQLDAAENAASHAIDLATEKGQEFSLCQLHRVLGKIYRSKAEKTKAIHHFETALAIASSRNWHEELFWTHHSLAELFGGEDEFDDANGHIEKATSHAMDDTYRLGRAMDMQANIWCLQRRLEDAQSQASQALEIYKICGGAYDAVSCRKLLQMIERSMEF